jgi:hypothetical protein
MWEHPEMKLLLEALSVQGFFFLLYLLTYHEYLQWVILGTSVKELLLKREWTCGLCCAHADL